MVRDSYFRVFSQSSKKVNNFNNSVSKVYLNYDCYKELINFFYKVTNTTPWLDSLDYNATKNCLDWTIKTELNQVLAIMNIQIITLTPITLL